MFDLILGRFPLYLLVKWLQIGKASPVVYLLNNYKNLTGYLFDTIDYIMANFKAIVVGYL
jgi:hypothetical protein